MESPELKKLVDSVGATAELIGILRSALIQVGFSEQDSLYLCSEVLKSIFTSKNKKE